MLLSEFYGKRTTLDKSRYAGVMDTADLTDRSWTKDAACKGFDPNMWFEAVSNDTDMLKKNTLAKSICHSCEVRKRCLEYSLHCERYGIWGGLTASDRDQIRRKRNIEVIVRRLM
jgi:WhiB family redox-sensing transcriptional regulator